MARLVRGHRSETSRHASHYDVRVTKQRWFDTESKILMRRALTNPCIVMRRRRHNVFINKKHIIVHQKGSLKQILQLVKNRDSKRRWKQMLELEKKKVRKRRLKQMFQCVKKKNSDEKKRKQEIVDQSKRMSQCVKKKNSDEKKRKRRLKQMLQFVFVTKSITYDMVFWRKIWCQIMINKCCKYPVANHKLYVGADPAEIKYAQIPGYHILVGYTYQDLFYEFGKFSGKKIFEEDDSELLEYFLFCKLYCTVCAFQTYDLFCVINGSCNYILKLQSIFTCYELGFPNLFVEMYVPESPKSLVDENVCVRIGLSGDWRFMTEAKWVMKAAQTRKFGWMNKIPSQIRPRLVRK